LNPGKNTEPCNAAPSTLAAEPQEYWQAWFDGSALPNPGRIGIGALLLAPDGTRFEKSELAGSGCNNEAELCALCAVLELADGVGATRLQVRGDSDVTIRYVLGPDRTGIVPLRELVTRARTWMTRFEQVQLVWIPRQRNGEADGLSRRALGLPAKPVEAKIVRRRR